jgi:hypothetical protein
MTIRKLPRTDSIEELAKFWDTHDLTDFEHGLEDVEAPVFRRTYRDAVSIELDPEEIQAAKRVARDQGRDLGGLLHDWVIEKLDQTLRTQALREAEQS